MEKDKSTKNVLVVVVFGNERNMKLIALVSVVFCLSGLLWAQGKKPIETVNTSSVAEKKEIRNVPAQTVEGAELQDISLEEAKRLFDEGNAVFLDTRSQTAFNTRHIKGALSCSLGYFDRAISALAERFQSSAILIVYCNGESCGLAKKVGMRLAELGHRNIKIFTGGWTSWVQSNYPMEP